MGMAEPDNGPRTDTQTSDQEFQEIRDRLKPLLRDIELERAIQVLNAKNEAEWAPYGWFRTHNRKARRALKAKARKAK